MSEFVSKNEDITSIIKNLPFFFDMSEEEIIKLSEFLKFRKLDSGRYVFKQSDKPDGVYFILEGKVKILKKHADGSEELLETHSHPSIFGEMAIIDGSRRAASAVTLEKFKALVLLTQDFEELKKSSPILTINIIRKIAHTLSLKLRIESNNRTGII